jgi:hypothetical protein
MNTTTETGAMDERRLGEEARNNRTRAAETSASPRASEFESDSIERLRERADFGRRGSGRRHIPRWRRVLPSATRAWDAILRLMMPRDIIERST